MKDLYNNLKLVVAISPATRASALTTGTVIDCVGYEAVMIEVNCGVVTDGTTTPALQESADNTTFGAVAAGDLQGAFVALVAGVQKVGYLGSKRYLRLDTAVAATTTGALYGATAVLGRARHNPAGITQAP
jgi:hypothetical protein